MRILVSSRCTIRRAREQKGLADPEGVGEMVLARIGRVGVNQYAQVAMSISQGINDEKTSLANET
jgi:hypothetical protein